MRYDGAVKAMRMIRQLLLMAGLSIWVCSLAMRFRNGHETRPPAEFTGIHAAKSEFSCYFELILSDWHELCIAPVEGGGDKDVDLTYLGHSKVIASVRGGKLVIKDQHAFEDALTDFLLDEKHMAEKKLQEMNTPPPITPPEKAPVDLNKVVLYKERQ